jgi:prolyl 4-hydroxylase
MLYSKLFFRLPMTRQEKKTIGLTGRISLFYTSSSFPVQHKEFNCGNLVPGRQEVYEKYMEGCVAKYDKKHCDDYENGRFEMSLNQPQSMVNYTSTGFKKIKAPKELYDLLKKHWDDNRDNMKEEVWGRGNIYVNHWESPTYMVSVEDTSLRGGGKTLKNKVWDAAKKVVEEWTQMELKPISQYGIRVYTEGAILSPHADRLPLVSSCIVNVDQDVDEDWILEVIDRQGNAVNVTMEPGDMVLYESGSLIHGRPFALKGRYYANIFIHFEPTGRPLHAEGNDWESSLDDFLPPYILPNSPWVKEWSRRNPSGWKQPSPSAAHVDSLTGHSAAAQNNLEVLTQLAAENHRALTAKDRNGWSPIHESVRGGHLEALDFLVNNGADVNERTHHGTGVTPLNIALHTHDEDHPVTRYLKDMGALNIGPEL